MSSSILKYGEIVRICSNEALNANPNSNNTFITSKSQFFDYLSYTDQNLYFQVYNQNEKYLCETPNQTINVPNYRESLFEILPTSSFEINDEMNGYKSEAKKKESAPRAKTEEEQFKAIIKEKRGKYISFGDRVVFKHLDSQYYMYGSFDCATSGIGAFKIELRKELSEKIVFQLMSYRTYEKEGDEMSINAPFRIYHCQTQCFVSYCFENIFLDKKFFTEDSINNGVIEEFTELPQIKTTHIISDEENERNYREEADENSSRVGVSFPIAGRFLIINENIPRRVFKLAVHNEFEMKPNKQNIKNHDIVYFIHTQDDKYLCCSNFKRGRKSDIFLKTRKNETDLTSIFDGLWEIEEVKTIEEKDRHEDAGNLGKSRTPNAKKPWMMNSFRLGVPDHSYLAQTITPNLQSGSTGAGFVSLDENEISSNSRSKKKYIIRHLISGRIMYINENQKIKVEEPRSLGRNTRSSAKPILLESVDSNMVDGSLVQFAHKTTETDDKKEKKIVKYFLEIQEDDSEAKKHSHSIQEALHEDDMISEEYSEVVDGEVLDEIETTYSNFFEIDELQMTTDSSQHGFRAYKIEDEIKQLALFVLSSHEIIYKFCMSMSRLKYLGDEDDPKRTERDSLKSELRADINVQILNNVINVFKGLIGFIYNCEYSIIAESGNSPNAKRQRIFDELGKVEMVTRLVEIIDSYDSQLQEIVGKSQSEYKKIRNIYVLAFELLESIAANNYPQKIKISKFLEKYLHQIKKSANKVVYRSIQEVLDGNYLALEKKVTYEYIRELIQNFDIENPDPADLYFLSRLCLCKDRTVIKNQNAVYESFYKTDEQKKEGFEEEKVADNKFKFREDQSKMQILSKISYFPPQFRTLSELYEQCEMSSAEGVVDPQKGHWNYFLQYLNLLADVCVHRNATPLQYILDNLPLKTLVAFLHESTVKKKLLFQPFIRLVHHAFVQNRKFEEINRITKVKEWNALGNFNIPKSSKEIEKDLQKTMNLIIEYIQRINRFEFEITEKEKKDSSTIEKKDDREPESIDFNPEDKLRLVNVKTFLEILKSTLNLGFWPTMEVMKKMVPYMLKVLKFDIEYARKKLQLTKELDRKRGENQHLTEKEYRQLVFRRVKQELTLNKPNIVMLVECKILAAQILNIIIDYEYNVRVSIITKYFKDVMEMDVDLSNYKFDKVKFIEKWKDNQEYEQIEPTNEKEGYLLNEQLWMDKVSEIISERDIFSHCKGEAINESLTMFETFAYENQKLTNMTFEILSRIGNERRQILKTFKDIIFVAGGNLSKLADRGVRVTRSVLLHLTSITIKDISVNSMPNCLWEVVRSDGRDVLSNDSRPLGAIQELAFLTMAMIKNGNPTLQRASKFYKNDQLYPFKDLVKSQIEEREDESDGSYLIIEEKSQNLSLNQNLIKSQDHHLLIIDFIKIMSDIRENEEKENIKPLPRRALHAAYNFLTVLVWNHNDNKKELEDLLRISECHLKFNIGTIDFYKEMYKNNKKLVKKTDISHIVHTVIGLSNSTDISLYQKSKLLDFLRIIVIFDDQGYDVNQNMVMEIISQYQVSSDNQIVILNTEDPLSHRIETNFEHYIASYEDEYFISARSYADLNVSPELFYIATFFEIFSALIENENVVNIGKCTNMHPLKFLLEYLGKAKNCWPLIRHLRAYVNKLYYFSGREQDTTLFEIFIQKDLRIIRNELRGIVELICNTPDYHIIKIKNPIRYTYLGSYVFLSLEEIMHSLDLMFRNRDFSAHISMLMSQISVNNPEVAHTLLEIIEMDEYLQKTIDGRYINKYLASVSKELKSKVANCHITIVDKFNELSKKEVNENLKENSFQSDDVPFKKNYVFHEDKGLWRHLIDWNSFKEQDLKRAKLLDSISKGIVKDPAESKEAEFQKKRDYMLDYIYLGNIEKKIQKVKAEKPASMTGNVEEVKNEEQVLAETNLPKNLTTSMSNRFRVKNERFENTEVKNNVINSRRKKLVKFIEINEQFAQFEVEETELKLYNIFANLNTISQQTYESVLVGSADVIKSIVKMNENDPAFIRPEYKLMIVQLLTNYIQRESPTFKQNIQDWALNDASLESVRNAQNFLNDCGCASFLCSLIVNDIRSHIKIGNSILMFGITLLLGQNQKNQSDVFKILKEDEKNILMAEIESLIKSCGTGIATHVFGKSEKEYQSSHNYSDTYDYFNDTDKSMTRKFVYIPETVEEQKEFELKVVSLQEAFIFLRVLCEGNNQIKNFIREQVTNDEDKKVKNESINFIALGVSEIKRMFQNFNINIVKVPFSIIDFIIEVTQIPCIHNQIFLCESSFFHDYANLQAEISTQLTEGVIEPTRENIEIINRLYSLSIKNVISCLEGNMEQIYNMLSSEDLCKFFVKCLAFYVKYLSTLERLDRPIETFKDLEKILEKNKLHENFYLDLFQVTSVIIKLKHKTPNESFYKKIDYNLNKNKIKQHFEIIEKNLLGIEITMDEYEMSTDRNQILFFPRHAVFNYLSRSTRARIMENINRSTQRDKIIGLFTTTHEISEEIDYNYYLDNEYHLGKVNVRISNEKIEFYQNLGMYIAALICLLMLLFSTVIYYPYDHAIEYDMGPETIIERLLAYIQFSIALIFYLLWTKNHLHLAIGKYQEEVSAEEQEGKSQSALLKLFFRIPFLKNIYCLFQYDDEFSGVLFYMFASFMGAFYRTEWFSLLLLSLMMKQIDVLKSILMAISTNVRMLGMLSLLGMAFISIFSIFSIHYYAESMYPQAIPKEHCETISNCIIELYINEQIGEDMESFEMGRFIYDMIYTIFMDMLFGNIVGGVLIDTFAELRQKGDQIEEDKKGKCFICGITKETLEKKNEDLKTHYKYQYHKLWNYVFYLYYLQKQVKKTGLEIIIQNKIKSEDVSWLPSSSDESGDIGEKIEELQKLMSEQVGILKTTDAE